ncbi:MAG: hypothetical protein KDD66_17285 [Bdellovibrionales bacterium]|nr:hypothetical protein [Bdellovibrionales bacterium]
MKFLNRVRRVSGERGSTMVEYVLLANFLVLGLLMATTVLATSTGQTYVDAGTAMVGGQQLLFNAEGGGTVQTQNGPPALPAP